MRACCSHLQQSHVDVRDNTGQSPPFLDGQVTGRLHQSVNLVKNIYSRLITLSGLFLYLAMLHDFENGCYNFRANCNTL